MINKRYLLPPTPINTLHAAKQRVEDAIKHQKKMRKYNARSPERIEANGRLHRARQKLRTVGWWYNHHLATGVEMPKFRIYLYK